jgi:hypothetical protein
MYDNVNRRLSLLEGDVDSYNFGKGGAELLFGCIPADDPAGSTSRRGAPGKPHAAQQTPQPLQRVKGLGTPRLQ